jgi:hypothetical protein
MDVLNAFMNVNTYCSKCNQCLVFHVLNVKNCSIVASLEYFYMDVLSNILWKHVK